MEPNEVTWRSLRGGRAGAGRPAAQAEGRRATDHDGVTALCRSLAVCMCAVAIGCLFSLARRNRRWRVEAAGVGRGGCDGYPRTPARSQVAQREHNNKNATTTNGASGNSDRPACLRTRGTHSRRSSGQRSRRGVGAARIGWAAASREAEWLI